MASSPINELLQAIDRVRRRRTVILHVRQIGWSLAILSAVLILSGLLAMTLPPVPAFSILLFCALAAIVAALVWRYGRAMRLFDVEDRRLAQYIDERTPGLEQRLLTSMDAWDKEDATSQSQLVASLWRDTLDHVTGENLQRTADTRPTWLAAGAILILILMLTGLIRYSDRFAGAARRVVWPWSTGIMDMARTADVEVSPGDILIRRGSDVTIAATLKSARPKSVFLYIREGAAEWQPLAMQPSDASKRFIYLLPGVSSDLDYYVDGGYRRSQQFRIQVFDLTRVESIDVDYRYPAYTGMESKTEKDAGDVMAPEGTQVSLQVAFNGPVQSALLRFDQGPAVDLRVAQNLATGTFTVTQDDTYVVDAVDEAGRQIENPPRYFVRATPDTPPEISVTMPGRDLRVMALEEVRIAVKAADDFGLTRLFLKYTVGGTTTYNVDLQSAAGQREIESAVEAKTLIYLEDLDVTPGDIVSYFVTARDNNGVDGPAETMSDIYFLEVISTDEAFRRASGGAGGMGQAGQGRPPSALVENQKNIIAATWKLLMRQRNTPGEAFDDDVGVVAESQQNLAQRTQMSLSRLTERFSFADESYDRSVLHLKTAVDHMRTAAEKLASRNLEAALGPEQAALQAILKAESQSRLTAIQMASNSGGAGGDGGSQGEREDLRELFAMEMGRLENRYEMPRTGAGSVVEDEVLRRLRELAQRQERLNRAQLDAERRKDRMTASQQRRRLEELRREQEALRREAQALSQRWSHQTGGHLPRSSPNALEQAIDRMQETVRDLKQGNPEDAAASGRAALQRLVDQEKRMRRRSASVNELVKTLAEKAAQLQAQEVDIVRQLESASAAAGQQTGPAFDQSADDPRDPAPAILSDIVAKKDDLKRSLEETEELLRAVVSKSKASHSKIALQATDAQRALTAEALPKQIEESKADLKPGRLEVAMQKESAIERSIARLGGRLQALDTPTPTTADERLREATAAAQALTRELENLRRTVEAFRLRQRRSSQPRGTGEADQVQETNRMSDGLERSRRVAQRLVQPWAEGEAWSVDARSIHRKLTRTQIEDFLNQPALWQKLMEPVRELASALREQLEVKQLGDTAFSPAEQPPPSQYESMVEDYYKSLSEAERF